MKLFSVVFLFSIVGLRPQAIADDCVFPSGDLTWNGYALHEFEVSGRECKVVCPEKSAHGKPWIWRARFWGHEPQTDLALLERGFHVAYADVGALFGNADAVAHWGRFYDHVTKELGFSGKPALEGMSRGGLIIYNWAIANPEKVACVYADAPVLDFKSWPGGLGSGKGSASDWELCRQVYGLSETDALTFTRNPIDNLKPLATAGVPLLHVVGADDDVVPVSENTAILEKRYREFGGDITVISKPGIGHHPHSLKDPKPIVDFIVAHTTPISHEAPAISTRLNAITPNEFEGSDIERINQAVALGAASGTRVVIPRLNHNGEKSRDFWLIDSAILVHSNTLLELENCRIKLSDSSRDNFIRSSNCGLGITDIEPLSNIQIIGKGRVVLEGADHPRSTGDSAKILGQRTYGTDAGVDGKSQSGDWRNIGILMAYVEHFRIENIHLKNAHSWAISLERCAYGVLRDLDFDSTEVVFVDDKRQVFLNQDGVDLRQGCHDITIDTITGHTGDDLVALTNIVNGKMHAGSTDYIMVSTPNDRENGLDDIYNITIRNVRGHSRGGHHIVRLLNASGLKIHDVIIDGLIDTSGKGKRCKAAIKIGDSNPTWGGVTPLGDTYNIVINNVMSRAQHTILIGGSLTESLISNVMKYDSPGESITWKSGKVNSRNVKIVNVHAMALQE